jgi:uncharacterized protein YqeY
VLVVRELIRSDLTAALKGRDRMRVAALRSLLSAIANAESVPPEPPANQGAQPTGSEHVAGSSVGLWSGESARRQLTEGDLVDIVGREVSERTEAADQMDAAGEAGRAARLREEAAVLSSYLAR